MALILADAQACRLQVAPSTAVRRCLQFNSLAFFHLMHYIQYALILLYSAIALTAMVSVLMDNRQPAKTVAWLLVLVFLPVAGIIFYFFFGQNTRKEKLIGKNSMDQLAKRSMLSYVEQKGLDVPAEHKALIKFFSRQCIAYPFKDNAVDIFTDGYGFIGALLHDVGKASEHIHIDIYSFEDDALGNLVADALIDKARHGVEVRVIYDDVGCWSVNRSFYERMRRGGIDVQAFMPVRFPAFTSKVNYRNHRKLCIIDGRVGYIGGMNIALRYVKGSKGRRWRDTHLRVEGSAVHDIQKAFLVDWYFVDRTLITSRKYYPAPEGGVKNNCIIQTVVSSPASPFPDIMHGYVRILTEARHYVYMETPYFMPTETVLFAMHAAVLAGVDVRLMVPERTDTRLAQWAGRPYIQQAADMGVRVYLYKNAFNHSKLLVCDDSLCSCGSTNIDFRSFENNFEANAFIYDPGMAKRMKAIFMEDARCCSLYDNSANGAARPFLKRFGESLARLFAPLL